MSFIANSLIRPLAQWYSEINSATLTGAIDVLVIEQEDGTFVSSPFHVRFGKLGVLKAKEKVVDIEINDEPVEIQMKLDDHGTAFFVEDVSDDEDEIIPPELATSPIPNEDASIEQQSSFESPSGVSRSLVEVFNNNSCDFKKPKSAEQVSDEVSDDVISSEVKDPAADAAEEVPTAVTPSSESNVNNAKLKMSRKKRRRRQFHDRHSRSGSKSSLMEMLQPQQQQPVDHEVNSSESGGDGAGVGRTVTSSDKATEESLDVEDIDNDADLDDDENETTPINSIGSSTPREFSEKLLVHQPSFSSMKSEGSAAEQSFLQSRLGDEAIESILETLKLNEDGGAVATVGGSTLTLQHQQSLEANYFSEPELMSSPVGSRPSSPVLSDTEYETKRQSSEERTTEQSWEWGKLPTTAGSPSSGAGSDPDGSKIAGGVGIEVVGGKAAEGRAKDAEAEAAEKNRQRRWTLSSFFTSSQAAKASAAEQEQKRKKKKEGVYLEDLKDDEEMLAIYVGSSRHESHLAVAGGGGGLLVVDDDNESGTGPSLPMSPHSVDGAIGGARIRYDSTDEDRHLGSRLLPDMALSLCGGLDSEKHSFSSHMFEQSLISFDDFVMKLKENEDVFSNPNLVVRIGAQYYTWQAACPIIMSTVLYGRTLPSELVKVIKGSYQEVILSSNESSPNSKATAAASRTAASSSWLWPFSSRREGLDDHGKKVGHLHEVVDMAVTAADVAAAAAVVAGPDTSITDLATESGRKKKKKNATARGLSPNSSEEGESDPDLRVLISGQGNMKFRKTLRLASNAIKQLNLKPGSNEAQFSVTTAYQGTSRCKCHIYWWKSTDRIVISDIDGTITKSDVLGHVLPIIGRDWAQSGVASLFTKIANNGYHLIYLSARAIGQASITKDYLSSIRQGDMNLPDGPLFLNPTSLVNAFHREVIEKKPEKFKIACLRDIQKLFPDDRSPFYAGYGNRVNDVFAYRAVGVPISRIFTINSKGELRHELTQTFLTSYNSQSSIVDHIFPPRSAESKSPLSSQQEYSSFTYWREPIVTLEVEEIKKEQK